MQQSIISVCLFGSVKPFRVPREGTTTHRDLESAPRQEEAGITRYDVRRAAIREANRASILDAVTAGFTSVANISRATGISPTTTDKRLRELQEVGRVIRDTAWSKRPAVWRLA